MTQTKTVYRHDTTGIYTGPVVAYTTAIDPDTWLGLPAHYLDAAPPALAAREAAKAASGKWTKVPDWRGVPLYKTADGSPTEITEAGQTPADVAATDTPPPSPAHTWQDGKWVVDAVKQAALDAQERQRLASQIDDTAAGVVGRFTVFERAYERRRIEAEAYKAAGYTGTMPDYIAMYATPAGKTAKEATDIVLAQAGGLLSAEKQIEALRMQKQIVLLGTDIVADRRKAAEIKTAIEQIGAAL